MNQHNNPPFFIGQQVVCLVNSIYPEFKKGKEFIIHDIKNSCACKKWVVDVGVPLEIGGKSWCPNCGHTHSTTTMWVQAKHFAPIITKRDHSNVEIAEEIKNLSIVEERRDVKKKEVAV